MSFRRLQTASELWVPHANAALDAGVGSGRRKTWSELGGDSAKSRGERLGELFAVVIRAWDEADGETTGEALDGGWVAPGWLPWASGAIAYGKLTSAALLQWPLRSGRHLVQGVLALAQQHRRQDSLPLHRQRLYFLFEAICISMCHRALARDIERYVRRWAGFVSEIRQVRNRIPVSKLVSNF